MSNEMKIYILELHTHHDETETVEFAGVFESAEKAKELCPSRGLWSELNRLEVDKRQYWVIYEASINEYFDVDWLHIDRPSRLKRVRDIVPFLGV